MYRTIFVGRQIVKDVELVNNCSERLGYRAFSLEFGRKRRGRYIRKCACAYAFVCVIA
jgi:hypothetical protein